MSKIPQLPGDGAHSVDDQRTAKSCAVSSKRPTTDIDRMRVKNTPLRVQSVRIVEQRMKLGPKRRTESCSIFGNTSNYDFFREGSGFTYREYLVWYILFVIFVPYAMLPLPLKWCVVGGTITASCHLTVISIIKVRRKEQPDCIAFQVFANFILYTAIIMASKQTMPSLKHTKPWTIKRIGKGIAASPKVGGLKSKGLCFKNTMVTDHRWSGLLVSTKIVVLVRSTQNSTQFNVSSTQGTTVQGRSPTLVDKERVFTV